MAARDRCVSFAVVDSGDFITPEALEALSESEQTEYLGQLWASFRRASDEGDIPRSLENIGHIDDAYRVLLSDEEYERDVRGPTWELVWDEIEEIIGTLKKAVRDDPTLTGVERAEAADLIERFRGIAKHKRDLESLGETPESD